MNRYIHTGGFFSVINRTLLPGFVLTGLLFGGCERQPPETLEEVYQRGLQAYRDSNYTAYLSAMREAFDIQPNDPSVVYNLAGGQALTGNKDAALFWLNRFADLGLVGQPEADLDFNILKGNSLFEAVVQRIETNSLPFGKVQILSRLPDSTMITQGIAFDTRSRLFYISSIHQGKVVTLDSTGGVGNFVAPRTDGLGSVFALAVDINRNLLWACSAVIAQTPPRSSMERGQTGLYAFDLTTGRLSRKVMLPADTLAHALGDLIITPSGDIYTSDRLSGAIYHLRPGSNSLESSLPPGKLRSPRGIVYFADKQSLIVADYATGLYQLDPGRGLLKALIQEDPMCLAGIEGLVAYHGDLIAIQNGFQPNRIVRLTLNSDAMEIQRLTVLAANQPEFDEPTQGVVVGRAFYFNGSSQWRFLDKSGHLLHPDQLRRPRIFYLLL